MGVIVWVKRAGNSDHADRNVAQKEWGDLEYDVVGYSTCQPPRMPLVENICEQDARRRGSRNLAQAIPRA